ncbi:MAG TPA: hypothetical protein VFS97_02345 [Nitrososphaeraceae archaeon]|nr:hypothetical protein [Nitrososphaeraceae archaeon]
MREKTLSYISLTLSRKSSLAFILIFTSIVVFDSTIVEFSSYSGVEIPISVNIAIFIVFSVIFVLSSAALLLSVRKSISLTYARKAGLPGLKYVHGIMIGIQIFTVAMILTIVFQMLIINEYSLVLLSVQTYLSHLSALVFLSFLVFLFGGWSISKRSYTIILYTIAFSLACINLAVSLVYLESYFTSALIGNVKPYSIVSYVTNFGGMPITESLSIVFDALSLSSFLLMWIASAIFLSQYRHKMGRIKYFSLMSIPLLYYIFPLQGYFGDIFFSLLQFSPVSYTITYILIFSATKQVGAVLFSLAFWAASALVYDNRIRKSLLISSIGMAILFGTFEIAPLQYHVYPPYGFITQAFIPLGAYLLLVGIFSSAKVISRDSELRKEFYKSAASQLSLLKTIGVSQMEKELEEQVKSIEGKVSTLPSEIMDDVPELEEENVQEILHDVLNELYYSKGKKEMHNSTNG